MTIMIALTFVPPRQLNEATAINYVWQAKLDALAAEVAAGLVTPKPRIVQGKIETSRSGTNLNLASVWPRPESSR